MPWLLGAAPDASIPRRMSWLGRLVRFPLRTRFRLRTLLLATAAVPVFFGVDYAFSERREEVHFSPDTFEVRRRVVLHSQFIDRIIRLKKVELRRLELIDFLVDAGYWDARPVPDPRWWQVDEWSSDEPFENHIALYLESRRRRWIDWSIDNPALAQAVWPLVMRIWQSEKRI
ncbi:MAG: hypothetical protein AAF596_08120, partial [Planctomycetota bacterium]